jgi:hypothetical protein
MAGTRRHTVANVRGKGNTSIEHRGHSVTRSLPRSARPQDPNQQDPNQQALNQQAQNQQGAPKCSRRSRARADRLVRDAAQFLTGTYALDLHARRRAVPDWAWMSGLAHAPEPLLTTWALARESEAAWRGTVDRWELAVSLLARELMTTAAVTRTRVEEVQRVFLDLSGSNADGHRGRLTPDRLVAQGLRALCAYRDRVDH